MVNRLGHQPAKPANPTRARYDLDFGAAFMQQGGRFLRALAASDHQNLFASKPLELNMFRCMRRQRTRQARKLWWTPSERTDACGNNQTARKNRLPFMKDQPEAFLIGLDAGNLPSIEIT